MKKQYSQPNVEQIGITPTMYLCLPPSAQTDVVTGNPQEATEETPVF